MLSYKIMKLCFCGLLLLLTSVAITSRSMASTVLTADTSRPESSTFATGEPVIITFTATGVPTNVFETLSVSVLDENGNHVGTWTSPVAADTSGNWETSWTAPSAKLGYYRVLARLSDGSTIPALGSRQAGYITYCVVPNPALRKTYSQQTSRFGMEGGFNANVNVIPYLGIRWVMTGDDWKTLEPQYSGQYTAHDGSTYSPISYNGQPWQVYVLDAPIYDPPTWATTGTTGVLTASGLTAWANFCHQAALGFTMKYPSAPQHLYQLTWEPNYPAQFAGTPEQLVQIYQAAYPQIHSADSKAVVLGPTCGSIASLWLSWHQVLVAAGLENYIDAVAIHPYYTVMSTDPMPEVPSANGQLVQNIHSLGTIFSGKPSLPFYGTEEGCTSSFLQANDLNQAKADIRQNIILLGEGYLFNIGFYIEDYAPKQGFGYYYNLVPGTPAGSTKVGPKPVVPAYAAQTYLLDGCTSDGTISGLGAGNYGYSFRNATSTVLALWTSSKQTQVINLPVGVNSVDVYDWMGNERQLSGQNDQVTLTLSDEPIYITGALGTLY